MSQEWWQDFFDQDYVDAWGPLFSKEQSRQDAATLLDILGLGDDAQVLDAPCGYGRVSLPLADLGVRVVGVDQSAELLAKGRGERGGHSEERLRYVQHNLREPMDFVEEESCDAAINLFSSVGYGTDDDDVAIFRNIAAALKPKAPLFIDTMHRDAIVARYARDQKPGIKRDGSTLWEEQDFDPVRGTMKTTWFWDGPQGKGQKSATIRIYALSELHHILELAGFGIDEVRKGVSHEVYDSTPDNIASRVGILARKR
jgi:SAM-dependent methyltransferase